MQVDDKLYWADSPSDSLVCMSSQEVLVKKADFDLTSLDCDFIYLSENTSAN